jgi:hypothetical protein
MWNILAEIFGIVKQVDKVHILCYTMTNDQVMINIMIKFSNCVEGPASSAFFKLCVILYRKV